MIMTYRCILHALCLVYFLKKTEHWRSYLFYSYKTADNLKVGLIFNPSSLFLIFASSNVNKRALFYFTFLLKKGNAIVVMFATTGHQRLDKRRL